jgi:serine/threonine protein kinase
MDNYEIVRRLDQGQFGVIYLAKKKDEKDKRVALKNIPFKK